MIRQPDTPFGPTRGVGSPNSAKWLVRGSSDHELARRSVKLAAASSLDLRWLRANRSGMGHRAASTYVSGHGWCFCGSPRARLLDWEGSRDPGARSELAGRSCAPGGLGRSQRGGSRGARGRTHSAQGRRLSGRSPVAGSLESAGQPFHSRLGCEPSLLVLHRVARPPACSGVHRWRSNVRCVAPRARGRPIGNGFTHLPRVNVRPRFDPGKRRSCGRPRS